MKAIAAERPVLLASQPGPNIENAKTPIAAQPIWAKNMLYFCRRGKGTQKLSSSYNEQTGSGDQTI